MNEAPADPIRKRSVAARIGVAALNVPLAGLGLLRLGRWQSALAWCATSQAGIAAWLLLMRAPVPSFQILIGGLLATAIIQLGILVCSIIETWRHSALVTRPAWWGRWYVVAGLAVASLLASAQWSSDRTYRGFYIPSLSMMPNFLKNDRLIADMRWRTPQIGNIILVQSPSGETRIYRVAALGGQTFAMTGGVPIIDGQAATQSPVGRMALGENFLGRTSGQLLQEHLPGEQGSHAILKVMSSPQDDVAAVRIPAGSVFLLGDNRDLAADSRIPLDELGVGILPASAIIGRPLYMVWSKSHGRIGQRIDH